MTVDITTKKRVIIVGAGAAGMSCAHQLAYHPDRFDVTLVESSDYCGGQAFSIPINEETHGAAWLNQGVQGGSHIFHHTVKMFEQQGHAVVPIQLHVSFGKEQGFWTNVFPTQLVERHRNEIKRFYWALRIVRNLKIVFAIIPVKVFLGIFWFSREFTDFMVLPTLALFLGTGNATPDVPTIVLERLFNSSTYGMWYPADPLSLVSNLPSMIVFPKFTSFYTTWQHDLESRGVNIRLSTEVTAITQRSAISQGGITVSLRKRTPQPKNHDTVGNDQDSSQIMETYDELVFAVLPDTAKALLGKKARWVERAVLGSAKFSDDITVTHWDSDYMDKWYTNRFDAAQAVSTLHGRDESQRISIAEKDFTPMYYIKQTPMDSRKLEMAFDCNNYQAQFPKDIPFNRHVFQTIFLNKQDEATWSRKEINPEKVIREDWWHQLCHSWTHYILVVPWIWILNSVRSKHITFAGSWTVLNAHEVAVMSGMAAAYSLGGSYPKEFEDDAFALLCFRCYLLLTHGKWYRKGANRGSGKEKDH
ncbi:hypothetical protein FRB98_001837 [Tulasnella sp. 332]|nr:hypothetical protein FRB98_001837 [Tulasnella sp. 332]